MYESVLGQKKPIMGLDIGYKTIKIMQLKGDGPGAKLSGVAEMTIPAKSLSKEGIKDKKQIAEAIIAAQHAAKPHSISARLVSSALPESLVFTKSIELPNMKPEEINKTIPHQANEIFPMPLDEMFLDWNIVSSVTNKKTISVLIVAAPKIIVNSLVETIKLANLELVSLETKPVSDVRALILPNNQNPYLIIDIGAKTSSIICFDQNTIQLTSTTSISGDDLASDFQTSVKNLTSEISKLIKYYQNRIGRRTTFRRLILAGGGANVADIAPAMEKANKIETKIGWPVIKTKTYSPQFATVIGLAIKRI